MSLLLHLLNAFSRWLANEPEPIAQWTDADDTAARKAWLVWRGEDA